MLTDLFGRYSLTCVDVGNRSIDVRQPFGREEVIEIFVVKFLLQDVGDVFVDRLEPRCFRAALHVAEELLAEIDLMHDSRLPMPYQFYDDLTVASLGIMVVGHQRAIVAANFNPASPATTL
jgi:hypothetical protein